VAKKVAKKVVKKVVKKGSGKGVAVSGTAVANKNGVQRVTEKFFTGNWRPSVDIQTN
jgi:hypothetical protein